MVETNSKPHIKETVDEAAWQKFLERITYVAVDAANVRELQPPWSTRCARTRR